MTSLLYFFFGTPRRTNGSLFLGCAGLMLTALYMQHGMELSPCPLCITQRVFVIAAGLLGLLAFLHGPGITGRKVYAGLGITSAVIGGGFSSRQLWLQSLPPGEAPACGPSLDYILDTFPLMEALEVLVTGDGDCAKVAWEWLGLSIPAWTLVAFIGLVLFNVWQLLRSEPANA